MIQLVRFSIAVLPVSLSITSMYNTIAIKLIQFYKLLYFLDNPL